MKTLLFILSPTAHGGCEVLTLFKTINYCVIPFVETYENPQSDVLIYSQNLLNTKNVELLTYLGSKEAVQAYILRTISVQLEFEQLSDQGYKFIPLNQDLKDNVQVEAQVFWKLLINYIEDYMVWQ